MNNMTLVERLAIATRDLALSATDATTRRAVRHAVLVELRSIADALAQELAQRQLWFLKHRNGQFYVQPAGGPNPVVKKWTTNLEEATAYATQSAAEQVRKMLNGDRYGIRIISHEPSIY